MLELQNIQKRVEGEQHLKDISLQLAPGSLNVLLGPTLAGKTSLMRIMAGLDQPTGGRVIVGGLDVTGVPVQKRNVAMVYQQFINYPAMTVYENIASPLRISGADRKTIDDEVRRAADLLKLTPYLDRKPLNLSGGQQQRTALARAIVKNADLVLLDEPLANLDYKLREEFREELPKIFARSGAIFIYATTEPSEALLLGGNTATLSEGKITQFGPTVEIYRNPEDLITARTFSDPPLNTVNVQKAGNLFQVPDGGSIPVPSSALTLPDNSYTLGFKPHHLSPRSEGRHSAPLDAEVRVTELTGSESFIHVGFADEDWVMLTHGIHDYEAGRKITVHLNTNHLMIFNIEGKTVKQDPVASPEKEGMKNGTH